MTTAMKNSNVVLALLAFVFVASVALVPSFAKADTCEPNCGTGAGFDIYDNYDAPNYYEPTSYSYYEPSSTSYYKPSDYSYYEPTSYDYYKPSDYDYYEPKSYNYSSPSYNYSNYNYPSYDYGYSYQQPSNTSTYSYVYDYDYSYDYVYDYDACSNISGNQPQGYNCYPPVTYDECSNIPGNQSHGYDCYPDNNNDDVSCNLDASDSSVDEGDRITLEWDTDGDVTYASINEGIGRVDEDGGTERVTVDEDTTFRLTVRNSHGDEDTCSVTVRVDDNNNFSSVSFTGEPTYNPPVVYLSDIPYTGLEDINPTLLTYWALLIAAAGAGVWFMFRKGLIPNFAFASAEPMEEGHVEEVTEGHVAETSPEVMSFLSAIASGDNDTAVDHLRDAAANGTGVEEFLTDAESVASDDELKAKVASVLEGAKETGIRGAKEALGA